MRSLRLTIQFLPSCQSRLAVRLWTSTFRWLSIFGLLLFHAVEEFKVVQRTLVAAGRRNIAIRVWRHRLRRTTWWRSVRRGHLQGWMKQVLYIPQGLAPLPNGRLIFPRFRMISRAARCYLAQRVEKSSASRVLKEEKVQDLVPGSGNCGL